MKNSWLIAAPVQAVAFAMCTRERAIHNAAAGLRRSFSIGNRNKNVWQLQAVINMYNDSPDKFPLHSTSMNNNPNHDTTTATPNNNNNNNNSIIARILNSNSEEESHLELVRALQKVGFDTVLSSSDDSAAAVSDPTTSSSTYECLYTFSKATGMLKYVSSINNNSKMTIMNPPKWVPLLSEQEKVMVKNGWSFLDADNVEPMSAFDVEAANKAGTYTPKWSKELTSLQSDDLNLSSIGYSLLVGSSSAANNNNNLVQLGANLSELTRTVLFEGKTDPRNRKRSHNGYSFAGSADQSVIPKGIFCTALGDLPLFTSCDLSPTTASSGWLSFVKPISDDHILHIINNDDDDRVEVICARTRLHLGHYFGRGQGYCINASALNFYPLLLSSMDHHHTCYGLPIGARPISWMKLLCSRTNNRKLKTNIIHDSSIKLLHDTLDNNYIINNKVTTETIALGAGCFWHVEFALRRLPGILSTKVGFAGGNLPQPTYDQVCKLNTGHAEVVLIQFDPDICSRSVLVDCFLAMHDPTISRAHGKRSKGVGQYRSCIFTTSDIMRNVALEAMEECKELLFLMNNNTAAALATEVFSIDRSTTTENEWFWRAEDKHQLHDERVKKSKADTSTLSFSAWLKCYGKRHETIWGSLLTEMRPLAQDDDDDGMGRIMI